MDLIEGIETRRSILPTNVEMKTTSAKPRACGEALIELLELYGVDTVFGIPGVHTLDLYRGLANSNIQHVLVRHEQGAGFMADGYARVTGKPGVCCLISGPGVTNATTPIGQAFCDSIPMLIISADADSNSLGKGWGVLHETTDLQAITAPLTAMSATAKQPGDVPELIGQAFSIFASQRPRPVHIIVPIDVLAMEVTEAWTTRAVAAKPMPDAELVAKSAELLQTANQPVIMVGGGAIGSDDAIALIAEHLQAAVVSSNNGKGILPAAHSLNLGSSIWRKPTLDYLAEADVVLAIGTELAETDSYVERLPINGKLIRVDIDPSKASSPYPAAVGIIADAAQTATAIAAKLGEFETINRDLPAIDAVREASMTPSGDLERQHAAVLNAIRNALPANGALFGDMTQITYTASYAYPTDQSRTWHYMAGYGTLGSALPMAIGAKVAQHSQPIVGMCGDGGLMFTLPELMVAIELGLSLPILVWNNTGLGQIRDDMIGMGIPKIGVDTTNPDYVYLCKAFGCSYTKPTSLAGVTAAIETGFSAEKPTFIEVNQGAHFLI